MLDKLTPQEFGSLRLWEPQALTYLDEYLDNIIHLAQLTERVIIWTFHWQEIIYDPKKPLSKEQMSIEFQRKLNKRIEEYEKSPKWQAEIQKEKEEKERYTNEANKLVAQLNQLDFSNFEEILDWFYQILPLSDKRIWVEFDRKNVISTFLENWYWIRVNTWKDFNRNDPENFARYIIWQGLMNFELARWIHIYLQGYINEWKSDFWKARQEEKKKIEEIRRKISEK